MKTYYKCMFHLVRIYAVVMLSSTFAVLCPLAFVLAALSWPGIITLLNTTFLSVTLSSFIEQSGFFDDIVDDVIVITVFVEAIHSTL